MSVSPSAVSSALSALKMYTRQVDRAAESIASIGIVDLSADPASGGGSSPSFGVATGGTADLADAMTSMMIAQRAFSAQLAVLRTADRMLKETVDFAGDR
jgi:hypothetical protein